MALDVVAAAVLLVALIAYAIFAGADFGGGVWTLLASGRRADQQRNAISRAMGPVWETNHVWLIFAIVVLWTAFPSAFAHVFTALLIPLVVALVGIIFRGAAFAFRHFGSEGEVSLPATGLVFAVASLLTPLALGVALGALAGGHIRIEDGRVTSGLYGPWLRPFSIICGFIGVAMCAFLTACFMTVRTSDALREDFRRRALAASVVLGGLTAAAIPIAYMDASAFSSRLAAPAPIATMAAAIAMGVTSLLVLWRRWYALAPPVAAATVALVIAAWGAAQYPFLILPNERIEDVAAGHRTLVVLLASLPIGGAILLPSLALLYWTFREKTDAPPEVLARNE